MPRPGPRPRRVALVRYYTPEGIRCTKSTPGAIARREQSETFYAKIGGVRVSLETKDEGEAWIELRRRLKRLADERAGLVDEYTDHATMPLTRHIEDWLMVLRSAGGREDVIATMRTRVLYLAELAGWKRLGDVTAASCLAALARLTTEPQAGARGGHRSFSPQTRNHYLSHVQQFLRWCAGPGRRCRESPLRNLRKVSVDADQRRTRRCPSDEEIRLLFAWLAEAPVRQRMTGRQRALGYQVAMCAGLRVEELRSLTRESFDLERAVVRVQAAYDKRRRQVEQPLPSWLVAQLREWFDEGGACWQAFPRWHAVKVLRWDLQRAGVAYSLPGPDGPLHFDFHALRVWFVSQVASQPGISPKTLMVLARHSTPALSLKIYARARQGDLRAAAEALPEVAPPPPPPEADG